MADQSLIDAYRAVLTPQLEAFLDNLSEEMTHIAIEDLTEGMPDAGAAMTERFSSALAINVENATSEVCVHYADRAECEPCGEANQVVLDLDESSDEDDEDEDED